MTATNYRQAGDMQELAEFFPIPKNAGNVRHCFYSSPEALAGHIETLKAIDAWGSDHSHWKNGRADFTGVNSMPEAIKIARDGWKEGAARVERIRDRINAANPQGSRLTRWDVAGAYPSIGRALSGNPLNMRRIDTAQLRRRPIITLLSDFGCNGGTPADAITNRAAVVAAVVDSIEAAGFACAVIGFETSGYGGTVSQLCAINIKEATAPADVARMAFGLGHVAMFRRLTWATMTEDSHVKALGGGLGAAQQLDLSGLAARDIYVLPSANSTYSAFRTEADAETKGLNVLLKALREQGCPAFPADENANAA